MSASASVTFTIGECFKSFEELQNKIKLYEIATSTKFWIRDSRTIEAARKRTNRPLSDSLKYYQVSFRCIHGGRKFCARGEGKRSTLTFRKNCEAVISLCASEDGSVLQVNRFDDRHNHEISQELFRQLPQQRKLTPHEQEEAKRLLQLKANKKMVKDSLTQSTGKALLLKDLSNIITKAKSGRSRNDLEAAVQQLMNKHGASVEVLVNEENVLHGIFFQDQQMKQVFSAYPELLCIDATYKLLELRFPLYIMLVEDGNGLSEVAAAFLLLNETVESLLKIIDIFKKQNLSWDSVRVIMTDKDITERDVLAKSFPDASLLVCLFHTFRTFRREITCEKMSITAGQRNLSLELLQQMAYSSSEEKYMNVYSRFQDSAPPEVIKYFDEQWHAIRNQWALGMKYSSGNFLNGTNNRLESLNAKLKFVISRHSSLEEFVENFFLILRVLRDERDHKAGLASQKIPVVFHSMKDPASINYMKHLTPYAYKFVAKQLELKDKIKLPDGMDSQQNVISSSEGSIVVTSSTCECISWKSMRLPCRHILATRASLGIDLFDQSLCDPRWSMDYYKSKQRIFVPEEEVCHLSDVSVTTFSAPKKKVLSQFEKFRRASKVTTKLASLASEESRRGFDKRITLLENLVSAWESGEHVSLVESVMSDDDSSSESDMEFMDTTIRVPPPPVPHQNPPPDESSHAPSPITNSSPRSPSSSSHGKSSLTSSPSSSVRNSSSLGRSPSCRGQSSRSCSPSTSMRSPLSIQSSSSRTPDCNVQTPQEHSLSLPQSSSSSTPTSGRSDLSLQCSSSPNASTGSSSNCLVPEIHILSTQSQSTSNKPSLQAITIPPVMRKRGRPKGHDLTVIGLPAKKKTVKSSSAKPKLVPFLNLHTSLKEKVMLQWFVGTEVAVNAIKNSARNLIEEEEVRPEKLPDAVVDENVDIHLIRKYFSNDAWLVVKDAVKLKQENPVFICKCCSHNLDESPAIVCDHCLSWSHIKCVGLKRGPKKRYWFCRQCHQSPCTN